MLERGSALPVFRNSFHIKLGPPDLTFAKLLKSELFPTNTPRTEVLNSTSAASFRHILRTGTGGPGQVVQIMARLIINTAALSERRTRASLVPCVTSPGPRERYVEWFK